MAVGLYDQELLGRGLGTEAIRLVCGYAFQTLGLYRIGIRVLAYNEGAILAYEKCGFVVGAVSEEQLPLITSGTTTS